MRRRVRHYLLAAAITTPVVMLCFLSPVFAAWLDRAGQLSYSLQFEIVPAVSLVLLITLGLLMLAIIVAKAVVLLRLVDRQDRQLPVARKEAVGGTTEKH